MGINEPKKCVPLLEYLHMEDETLRHAWRVDCDLHERSSFVYGFYKVFVFKRYLMGGVHCNGII